jgi:hypothetical protein
MNLAFRIRQIISNELVFDVAVCMAGAADIKYRTDELFGSEPIDDRWQHRLPSHLLLLHGHFVFLWTTAKTAE